ncbi:hypothetical protein [Dyella psychrodurans]|uniref:Uncharacterized protein n=1 Tax=Dyella psychrodurans TaxID=1927960 RepID=A0A370XAV5_9GAMM|nr:hypothetical protein [Dyella psychrodurans]RDS85400.1 hypothetical protein DWU99_07740 [Dyella psychrodurans]
MKQHSLLLVLLLLPAMAMALPSGPPQVTVHGTVTTSTGEHPAWFTLICTQGNGAALSLQLMLSVDSAPDFPFDAFEGPRAPASYQPSAQLQAGDRRFAPAAVAGWRSGDVDGAFVFGITSAPGNATTATQVAAALGKPGVKLTWIQLSDNIQTPPLSATFAPDDAQSKALKQIAAPCLSSHPGR